MKLFASDDTAAARARAKSDGRAVAVSPSPATTRSRPTRPVEVDVKELERELKLHLRGEVRFDDGARALYATDASNYRQAPIGVVIPKDKDDVVAAVNACRKFSAPIVPRGGGTSLSGSTCNAGVVFDFTKYMHRVIEVNADGRWAKAQPGCILDDLRDAAEPNGLTFGPDPSTHNRCVIGGMLGNNSCGMHAQMAGRVSENVHELEIVTYDGLVMTVGKTSEKEYDAIVREGGRKAEIYRALKALADRYGDLVRRKFPHIPRRVSGFNLDYLLPENGFHIARALVGSEGTCVSILEAKLRLVYSPAKRSLVSLGYDDIFTAADHVPELLEFGVIGLEAMDQELIHMVQTKGGEKTKTLKLLPEGKAYLLLELEGETRAESDARARRVVEALKKKGWDSSRIKTYDREDDEEKLWEVRESGLGATAFVPGRRDGWPGWEDSAVPPEHMGDYLRDFKKLLGKHGYDASLYGHFGQGCLHCRIDFELKDREGIDTYRAFVEEAADLCVRYGGVPSGEHGDGQARGELLEKVFGPELMKAMQEFKSIWDPRWKMNPGKVIGNPPDEPYALDDNLRLGTDYNPQPGETHFKYPGDHGFAHATLRCVGVGICRRTDGGTMCPSYKVTREEMHTTRGRAHILFEMLRGGIIKDKWKSRHVKEALDLCLSCKGCKGDCPVQVDIATHKAEFLSHYYKRRLRPRSAYSMGGIYWWARLASHMPSLVNFLGHTKGIGTLIKKMGGIAPERDMPRFAKETFKEWFARRPVLNAGKPEVILWADTFNNHFHPDVAKAAVEVLEDAGFRVIVPRVSLCCGRPLYDYGFLKTAKRLLEHTLDALRQEIRDGVPIVGLEPSCLAVFKDEMPNLMPHDEDAKRLQKQVFLFSEFLNKKASQYEIPRLERKAKVQGHCHHKAIFGMKDEEEIMKKMGLDAEVMETGCCGLAGSFGFEAKHYDISVKIAEEKLLPTLAQASDDTLIITNGFSCHTQIQQLASKKALHLTEVLKLAIEERQKRLLVSPNDLGSNRLDSRRPSGAEPRRERPPEASL